jgi:hypothetical protein
MNVDECSDQNPNRSSFIVKFWRTQSNIRSAQTGPDRLFPN